MGGPLLWPADQPWPFCAGVGVDRHLEPEPDPDVVPLVPVLQLLAEDVPELPYPAGTDVLQVLWCPFEHPDWCTPRPTIHWRRRPDAGSPLAAAPVPHDDAESRYLPHPCVIDPETVIEYPSVDLPYERWRAISQDLDAIERDTGWSFADLTVAEGTKVGGYPGWSQSPQWPTCRCGAVMQHLLTIASWEFSRGDDKRWLPLEDRPAMDGWGFDSADDHPWWTIQNPSRIMLGDAGGMFLFECLTCEDRPFEFGFDCA